MLRAALCMAAALLAAAAGATAQGVPAEFEESFASGARGACSLAAPVGEGERIQADIAFRNRPGSLAVTADIKARTAAGEAIGRLEWETPYAPTSVCATGTRDSTLYVVGWVAARSEVVVEEWTFARIAVTPPAAPQSSGTLDVPPPARRLVLATTALPIVRCAAFHPQAGLLFLLCDGEPAAIRVLDVRSGRLLEQPLASSREHPVLSGHRSLVAGRDREAGFLLYTESRPRWGDPRWCPEPCRVLEWRDVDLDGRFESTVELGFEEFIEVHAGRWIPLDAPASAPAPTGAPR